MKSRSSPPQDTASKQEVSPPPPPRIVPLLSQAATHKSTMAPVAEAEEEACLISKEVAHVLAVLAMRNNPMKEDSLKVREAMLGEMGAVGRGGPTS